MSATSLLNCTYCGDNKTSIAVNISAYTCKCKGVIDGKLTVDQAGGENGTKEYEPCDEGAKVEQNALQVWQMQGDPASYWVSS